MSKIIKKMRVTELAYKIGKTRYEEIKIHKYIFDMSLPEFIKSHIRFYSFYRMELMADVLVKKLYGEKTEFIPNQSEIGELTIRGKIKHSTGKIKYIRVSVLPQIQEKNVEYI